MTEQTVAYTVLVYSDDPLVREHMQTVIGPRPARDVQVRFLEGSTYAEVVELVDNEDVDLVMLDGEAAPGGGIGIARQLKDEVDDCPPTCVVIARAADRWLASYARVDATLIHPLDPVLTGRAIADLLRTADQAVPAGQ
mgnify:FL=1